MIKAADDYVIWSHGKHLECVWGFFSPPFGAFYPCPNVSAVTLSLQASEVIKSCGSHAMQIILPAVDTQV